MSDGSIQTPGGSLSPNEAFDIVGDETRIQILKALGQADRALSYTELLKRIDYESTNFHYHLNKLVGHFIEKTEDGYVLRTAGRQVVIAVFSGAMRSHPTIEREPVELDCPECGGGMEMTYKQRNLLLLCTECKGTRGGSSPTVEAWTDAEDDVVGHMSFPAAGIEGRTAREVLRAAEVWTVTEAMAISRGVCPNCAGMLKRTVRTCEDHNHSDGRCESCDQRFGVTLHAQCTKCITEGEIAFGTYLLGRPALLTFMIDHGIDPLHPQGFHISAMEESIASADPFEAEFEFSAGEEVLRIRVGDDLSVESVTRQDA